MKIAIVLGTRPEAIKLAPVARRFLEVPHEFETRIVVTAQHRGLLDQTLRAFAIAPDYDLDVMRPGQTLAESTSRIVAALDPVFAEESPDLVMVQGDTTTTFCGALGAFYRGLPVAHVEAGLRTGDLRQPFPEETNRVLTTRLATLHLAPTEIAAANLLREGVDAKSIFVTGNTGIDAVLETRDALAAARLRPEGLPALDPRKKLILVTAHRRESFGDGLEGICDALARLAARDDLEIVYPVHPNPNVRAAVGRRLRGMPAIHLIEPLSYVPFVDLMRRAHVLLTDSGGIQEEGRRWANRSWCCAKKPSGRKPWPPAPRALPAPTLLVSSPKRRSFWTTPPSTRAARASAIPTAMATQAHASATSFAPISQRLARLRVPAPPPRATYNRAV